MVNRVKFAFVLENHDLVAEATDIGRCIQTGQRNFGGLRAVLLRHMEYFAPCGSDTVAVTRACVRQLIGILAGDIGKGRSSTDKKPSIPSTRSRKRSEERCHGTRCCWPPRWLRQEWVVHDAPKPAPLLSIFAWHLNVEISLLQWRGDPSKNGWRTRGHPDTAVPAPFEN